jgi:hypothetical protein
MPKRTATCSLLTTNEQTGDAPYLCVSTSESHFVVVLDQFPMAVDVLSFPTGSQNSIALSSPKQFFFFIIHICPVVPSSFLDQIVLLI